MSEDLQRCDPGSLMSAGDAGRGANAARWLATVDTRSVTQTERRQPQKLGRCVTYVTVNKISSWARSI
jgi:hypothetical protein